MTKDELNFYLNQKLSTPVIEGKSKKFYDLGNNIYFMVFKPHLRSITSKREENIDGTDIERLKVTEKFFNLCSRKAIPTQLLYHKIVEIDEMQGLLVEKTRTIPLEFIVRYYAAGSIVRLFPSIVIEGQQFKQPLLKYDLKQDISVAGVDDPTMNESYIVGLGLLKENELKTVRSYTLSVADIINKHLKLNHIKLIDMKMEFGFTMNGEIVLIDEVSQDCIRANDMETDESLTKDAFRNMKTDEEVLEAYKNFTKRTERG